MCANGIPISVQMHNIADLKEVCQDTNASIKATILQVTQKDDQQHAIIADKTGFINIITKKAPLMSNDDGIMMLNCLAKQGVLFLFRHHHKCIII